MELQTFLNLEKGGVSEIVRGTGPQVCVFPINGTRRWFMLEHASETQDDQTEAYMQVASRNHIGLYQLFFEHGIDTLLTPAFGPDLLLRGDEYVRRIGAEGLGRLANDPLFLDFYEQYQVRVYFYGEHRKYLHETPFAYLSDWFDQAAERTRKNERFRLFFGIFAHDATERIAELAVEYYREHGSAPSREALVERYYGEFIPPVSLFIGFDRLSVFDYPLLSSGEEDLYFTIAPSPYLTEKQLRMILFDHLFTRPSPDVDYSGLSPEELTELRGFYRENRDVILGVGKRLHGLWVPNLDQGLQL